MILSISDLHLEPHITIQGFASGSLDEDASSVRLFAARGMELLVAQSYSKNLGLYAERIGAINVLCSSADAATRYDGPKFPFSSILWLLT